ncbi:iron-containing alcohol dehydrogenase [Pelagibius marinus]|uniref:iron-containing alcohol dehydrogenase n=1 Tax=Pelagibius marinus TaxID=2762760 RepID=UPI001872500C|nr:iron-containing alcohol dehydrogenase [Pelagibius marinus]
MPSDTALDNPQNLKGNWNYPTQMIFGPGRIKNLGQACKTLGMTRPLLVTDPGLAGLPMVKEAIAANEAEGLPTGLFDAVKPNPVGHNVEEGVKAYKDGGHDGVIAFGGGSGLDCAKAVALMVGQSRPLWDFEDKGDNWKRVDPDGVAPIVAVPTTAGTGSEVGRASVIVDEASHTKKIIFHPKMLPSTVISDPELTVGLPPNITAATGMDALAHCIEAYCAPGYHPMAEGIAVEGIRLVKEWLPAAVHDGKNLAARAHMLAAASMGATAFQKGLGAIHSLSHPVGALYDTHHGLTNAVFMPYVLAFNRPAIEDKMGRLAAFLGLENASFTGFQDWVLALRAELKIPEKLDGLGVGDERIDEIAEAAAEDPTAPTNPVPAGAAEMRRMFEMALEGRL